MVRAGFLMGSHACAPDIETLASLMHLHCPWVPPLGSLDRGGRAGPVLPDELLAIVSYTGIVAARASDDPSDVRAAAWWDVLTNRVRGHEYGSCDCRSRARIALSERLWGWMSGAHSVRVKDSSGTCLGLTSLGDPDNPSALVLSKIGVGSLRRIGDAGDEDTEPGAGGRPYDDGVIAVEFAFDDKMARVAVRHCDGRCERFTLDLLTLDPAPNLVWLLDGVYGMTCSAHNPCAACLVDRHGLLATSLAAREYRLRASGQNGYHYWESPRPGDIDAAGASALLSDLAPAARRAVAVMAARDDDRLLHQITAAVRAAV